MSNITSQFPVSPFSQRQPSQQGYQAAASVSEQSVRYQENTNTDLFIETSEGDRVTLNTNSFAQLTAYTYDSMGIVRTENGEAAYSMSQSEITLASGKSFSFTVEGDLSEEELADIGSILSSLDGIMDEMVNGNMDEAFTQAMDMGTYGSVASYEANLSYAMSYESVSSTAAAAAQSTPLADSSQEGQNSALTAQADKAQNSNGKGHKYGHLDAFEKFFTKLVDQLDKHGDKEVGLARSPINQLFMHHIDELENKDAERPASIYSALEKAMDEIDTLIQQRLESSGEAESEEPVSEEG